MVDLFYHHFRTQAFFDRSFNIINVRRRDTNYSAAADVEKPDKFEEMLWISEGLGKELDFLRVDLYLVNGRIYFGEFALYPVSGLGPYDPQEFDFQIGSFWNLDTGNANPENETGGS